MAHGGTPHVTVQQLVGDEELAELELRVLAGADGLDRKVLHPRVQKPGLSFAGYYPYIKPGRVQIVGESEIAYLATVPAGERAERFERITALDVPCFVVTKGLTPPDGLRQRCGERRVPLLGSTALSSVVIKRLSWFLEEHLVPSTVVHGVFLDIYGLGVLLIGESGVGKSECALDLITRGHSLVADDRVTVKRYPSDDLVGFCEEGLRHHMELRGLGIINVQDLFGLAAVRDRKALDLVVELEHWREGFPYERLGLDETLHEILGVSVPYIKMPVALGRNLSILVEIAARNHVLKLQGHHTAREFTRKLQEQMERDRTRRQQRARAAGSGSAAEPPAGETGRDR